MRPALSFLGRLPVAAAQRGDIAKVADLSFDCLMCGLCASRCPAEIVQYNVAILARRLYSRHLARPAAHLAARVAEIEAGACEADLDAMVAASERPKNESAPAES